MVVWDLRRSGSDGFGFETVAPGEYVASLSLGGYQMQQRIVVEADAKVKVGSPK
jgi:hypothetical protein